MANLPIFVISLARAAARRAAICRHLDGIRATYRLVDAVDGTALSDEERRQMLAPGVEFHPGVVGCYLSHTGVYRTMLREQIPLALILEDDVVLTESFLRLQPGDLPSDRFDYCFLDCDQHAAEGPIFYNKADRLRLGGMGWAYRLSGGPSSTHAYMITQQAAARRLQHELPIEQPIDCYGHLRYAPIFYAMIRPDVGACLSDLSLASFTVASGRRLAGTNLRFIRSTKAFYRFRNLVHPTMRQKRRKVPALIAGGKLSPGGCWKPLPDGRMSAP